MERVELLTPSALRSLAAAHGVLPRKSLGQHFLVEPALARRIADLAAVGPESRVVEVGAGLGSLTRALAAAGARVVAVEVDPRLVAALRDTFAGDAGVRVVEADAVSADWASLLDGEGPWSMVANLPYNVAVPVVMGALSREPRIQRFLVMVQREVGERLAAGPGDPEYGAVSVRVAYHARAEVVRRVPPTVFWPRPNVESVLVSLVRRAEPRDVSAAELQRVVNTSFAQRRKTMRNAVIRMGVPPDEAPSVLHAAGIDPGARPEELALEHFLSLSRTLGPAAASAG